MKPISIPLAVAISVFEAASQVHGHGDYWIVALQADGSTHLYRFTKPEDATEAYRATSLGWPSKITGRGFALVSCEVPIELYQEQLILEAVTAEGQSTERLATNLTKRIKAAAATLIEERAATSRKNYAARAKRKQEEAQTLAMQVFGEGEPRPFAG